MTIKSFNVEDETYKKFSEYCKNSGVSMSKQVEFFMRSVVEEDPIARKEYLDKLDNIRKSKFLKVSDFSARYNL